MFCPSCGSEQQHNQYCRACGVDLRVFRLALEKPEALVTSSARDEIGRAFADKIREMKSAKDVTKLTEEVLPQIVALLESPAEKRLRRIRAGVLTSAIGFGAGLGLFLLSAARNMNYGLLFYACGGLAVFLIGLGLLLNGWHFTVPPEQQTEPRRNVLPPATLADSTTNRLAALAQPVFSASVTEHTTHQLAGNPLPPRQTQ